MKERRNRWLILFPVCYLLAALTGTVNHVISCLLLLFLAVFLYVFFTGQLNNLINLPGLLGLFFFGGEGLACLKLSRLSSDWEWMTWLCFFLFYACFLAGYYFVRVRNAGQKKKDEKVDLPDDKSGMGKRLFISIIVLTAVSFAAFLTEAVIVGYIPAFVTDMPHAYSYFHVSGVHYFTVSSVFVAPLSVIFLYETERKDRRRKWLIPLNLIAIAIPILIVSRYFLIMTAALTLLTAFALKGTFRPKTLLVTGAVCLVLLIPAYVLLTVLRGHSVDYLNSIFEMKNENIPIFITQPYIYVTNNYENFNCLVRDVAGNFTYGLRELYPLFALTGLKFVLPSGMVLTEPTFVTKEELTTVTILYDAYYDFGVFGIVLFGLLLGLVCALLTDRVKRARNPVYWVLYAQMAMYLVLSFFTTWFSNPTTWFWFVITGMLIFFVQGGWKRRGKIDESSHFGRRIRDKNQRGEPSEAEAHD